MTKQLTSPQQCSKADCRITYGLQTVTCMAYQEIYDKHGNLISGEDPNTHITTVKCLTCGSNWIKTVVRGNETWRIVNEPV